MENDTAAALERRLKKIERDIDDLKRGRQDLPGNALGIVSAMLRVLRRGKHWTYADTNDALFHGADLVEIQNKLRKETDQQKVDKGRPLGG